MPTVISSPYLYITPNLLLLMKLFSAHSSPWGISETSGLTVRMEKAPFLQPQNKATNVLLS